MITIKCCTCSRTEQSNQRPGVGYDEFAGRGWYTFSWSDSAICPQCVEEIKAHFLPKWEVGLTALPSDLLMEEVTRRAEQKQQFGVFLAKIAKLVPKSALRRELEDREKDSGT